MDGTGQTLAYVYGHADQRDAQVAKALNFLDEARRIAANIAKLPALLGKGDSGIKLRCHLILKGAAARPFRVLLR